jgi:hypothetical protein
VTLNTASRDQLKTLKGDLDMPPTRPEPLAELPPRLRWRPGPITDWIDMEFVLQEIEGGLRNQVIAAQFETLAAVHRTLAEGASKMAGIMAGGKQRG